MGLLLLVFNMITLYSYVLLGKKTSKIRPIAMQMVRNLSRSDIFRTKEKDRSQAFTRLRSLVAFGSG